MASQQGLRNVLKLASATGKVGSCDKLACLSQGDCYDQSVTGNILSSSQWNSSSCQLVLKPCSQGLDTGLLYSCFVLVFAS